MSGKVTSEAKNRLCECQDATRTVKAVCWETGIILTVFAPCVGLAVLATPYVLDAMRHAADLKEESRIGKD